MFWTDLREKRCNAFKFLVTLINLIDYLWETDWANVLKMWTQAIGPDLQPEGIKILRKKISVDPFM
jgi:hypothetical protein